MKIKLVITISLACLSINSSFAQHKKSRPLIDDYIDMDKIYVQYKSNIPHNLGINNYNIRQLFGKPLKIEKGKSEMTELMYKEYTYPFGVIDVENGYLDNIEFKRTGLAYVFKIKNSFSKKIQVGSDAEYLKLLFPNSYKLMKEGGISVQIKNCDCNISFNIKEGKVSSMMFFTNNS